MDDEFDGEVMVTREDRVGSDMVLPVASQRDEVFSYRVSGEFSCPSMKSHHAHAQCVSSRPVLHHAVAASVHTSALPFAEKPDEESLP